MRRMENIKAGSVITLSLRSFGGFSNAKSAGFWGSAPDPDGGASSAPPSQRKNLIDLGHDLGNRDQDKVDPGQESRS